MELETLIWLNVILGIANYNKNLRGNYLYWIWRYFYGFWTVL